MAGHSKWAQIKRKKAVVDARRGKLFTKLIREITVAVREGGPDPEGNPRLRLAIENARAVNMPKENIERAIKKAAGHDQAEAYQEVTYEGYAPGGVAIFIDALTDNPNRTVAEVRHLFSRHGGNLGTSGSVAYMFERKGIIHVPSEGVREEDLLQAILDAGAEDLALEGDVYVVTTPREAFAPVREALMEAGFRIERAALEMVPMTTVKVDPDTARRALRLIEALEDLDDVQAVYTNLEMDEETVAALSESGA